MATKLDNAQTINDALGLTIDADQYTADQLAGWATRVATEAAAVRGEISATAEAPTAADTETTTNDSLTWRKESTTDKQVRVYVTTKRGVQRSLVAKDEATGRKLLRDSLKADGLL